MTSDGDSSTHRTAHSPPATHPHPPSHQSNAKRYGAIAAVVGLTVLCAVSLSANNTDISTDANLISDSALDQANQLNLDQEWGFSKALRGAARRGARRGAPRRSRGGARRGPWGFGKGLKARRGARRGAPRRSRGRARRTSPWARARARARRGALAKGAKLEEESSEEDQTDEKEESVEK